MRGGSSSRAKISEMASPLHSDPHDTLSSPADDLPSDVMPGWRVLFPVYVMSLTLPVDDAVVLPSLWDYVQDLGGTATMYGAIQAAYYAIRVVALPIVGCLIDRNICTYTSIFFWTLVLGIASGVLYCAAPGLGGLPTLVVARTLVGVASSASVATLAYVADHVPAKHRIAAFGINFGLQRACVPIAPLLNLLLVNLPDLHIGVFPLNQYTYVGLLTAILNGMILATLALLREPPRKQDRNAASAPKAREVLATLGRTGAYMSYFMSFQNNWTNQVVLWTMPLITGTFYPWFGTIGNSIALASGGIAGVLTVCVAPRFLKGYQDRWILLITQLWQGLTIVPYIIVYGCESGFAPPFWCLFLLYDLYSMAFIAQMPANNAIYTKLIGPKSQGVFLSLLEVSKAAARIFAGGMIGEAYDFLGSCTLWVVTLCVWAVQFVPFLANWRRLAV